MAPSGHAVDFDDAASDMTTSSSDMLSSAPPRKPRAHSLLEPPCTPPSSLSPPSADSATNAAAALAPHRLPAVGTVGVASDANPRFRASDEDAHAIIPALCSPPPSGPLSRSPSDASTLTCNSSSGSESAPSPPPHPAQPHDDPTAFLAVYDGHGGAGVAHAAAASLHLRFAAALSAQPGPPSAADAFSVAYADLDAELRAARFFTTGATAVTTYVHATPRGGRVLTTANVGDARAVLCRAGEAVRLSTDHRAAEATERARIEAGGGFVCARRVNGVLEVSRALGDHCFKSAVISQPSVDETVLCDADEFLLLACDGLWDFVDEQRAVDIASDAVDAGASATAVADVLVKAALAAGSTDNITVLCTLFTDE